MKKGKTAPLFLKMSATMALLVFVQLLVLVAAMIIGGVFPRTRQYAYNTLLEKTENRAVSIENYLAHCTSYINIYAEEMNDLVTDILAEEGKSAADILTDKALNKRILADGAPLVVSLCRISSANDAFVYLNTGDLYKNEIGDVNAQLGFYVRDIDTYTNDLENNDLLLEAGDAEVALKLGIVTDSGWSHYTAMSGGNDLSFFTEPISAYKNNPNAGVKNCGYWSRFSRISDSALPSMKYSIPLVLDDGTLYGVIGIGLLEKNITSSIPASDFLNDSACYILGCDPDGDGVYDMQVYSGAAYTRLVSDKTLFDEKLPVTNGMQSFDTNVQSVGRVVGINLYGSDSLFGQRKWALISVADSNAILEIYNKLVNTFIISALIALFIGVTFSLVQSGMVTKPVSDMTNKLKNSDSGDIISFVDSGIDEFDTLAKSIVELQINVREHASRVSDILSLSESGIGTFMYDRRNGSVFVGKSLLNILDFPGVNSDEDFTIPFSRFCEYLSYFEEKYNIFDNEVFSGDFQNNSGINIDTEYDPAGDGKNTKWFRFSFTGNKNAVMGLVQDITKDAKERLKIEHERDFDVTTDIYNRRAFYRRVEKLFAVPEKLGVAAFVMMDLDNLKFVNDTFGHEYGDKYIKAAANALKTLQDKNGVVARLSGDEFIAFIYGGKSKDDIREVIEEFKETLSNSSCTLADGTSYKVRASGGISWYPDNSTSYEQLIKYADFSMYTIKHSTKGCFAEFNESRYLNDSILVTGIQEMNRIIDTGAVRFAFQPVICVKSGEIFGYEALMCPQSETIKTISDLLRIAKSGAKLYEIERLTFFLGIASFSRLIENGKIPNDAHLFLNSISECMLDERAVRGIEDHYRPILKNIVLENIDVDHHNSELIAKKHEIIKKWGGMTALDNFGMGHNNETEMFTSNPDMIIIDRTIVEGCTDDTGKATIIRNLVNLAKERGVLVVAQGVETDEEMRMVIKLGADLIQGYYFAPPSSEPKPISQEIVSKIAEYRV